MQLLGHTSHISSTHSRATCDQWLACGTIPNTAESPRGQRGSRRSGSQPAVDEQLLEMKQKRHSVQRTRCQERISHVQETCFSCLFTFWERLMGTGTNTSCPLNGGGKETERDRGPSQGHTARGPAQDLSSEPAFHGFFPDLNLPHHCCDPTPNTLLSAPLGHTCP